MEIKSNCMTQRNKGGGRGNKKKKKGRHVGRPRPQKGENVCLQVRGAD